MTWKTGDLEPSLAGTFYGDGVPVSLADAVAVKVHILKPGGSGVINRSADLGDQDVSPGSWSLEWVPGDLDEPGGYQVELEVEWAVDRMQTTPTVEFYVAQQIA